jgi:hypothetical protein
MAERISVTVSIVATASYSGVGSSTRRRPTNPASAAAASPTWKIRRSRRPARRTPRWELWHQRMLGPR